MTHKTEIMLRTNLIVILIPLLITLVVGVADRPHLIDRCWPMWLGWLIGMFLSTMWFKLFVDADE